MTVLFYYVTIRSYICYNRVILHCIFWGSENDTQSMVLWPAKYFELQDTGRASEAKNLSDLFLHFLLLLPFLPQGRS